MRGASGTARTWCGVGDLTAYALSTLGAGSLDELSLAGIINLNFHFATAGESVLPNTKSSRGKRQKGKAFVVGGWLVSKGMSSMGMFSA